MARVAWSARSWWGAMTCSTSWIAGSDEVTGRGGSFLLLAGEAGVGKTRLLGAMERRAAAAGFRTVRGGAYPSDISVPGAILIDLAALDAPPGRHGRRRTPARREARGSGAAGTDDARDPLRRRRLLVLDVAEILVETAADAPAAIALEDLHWATT